MKACGDDFELTLEYKETADATSHYGDEKAVAMVSPVTDEDYWIYRVAVSDRQAIVGFLKFGIVGIGFQIEDTDWNVNLPADMIHEQIYEHIAVNKGDDTIPRIRCVQAIIMIQSAARRLIRA